MTNKFLTRQELLAYYDISPDALDVFLWKFKDEPFIKNHRVCLNTLLAIQQLRKDLYIDAQEYYYFFAEDMKDMDIARLIATKTDITAENWSPFIAKGMWQFLDTKSIINLVISPMVFKFVAAARQLICSKEFKCQRVKYRKKYMTT